MLLGMVRLLLQRRVAAGGAVYGLAVHFRVFPVVYGLPLLSFLLQAPALHTALAQPVTAARLLARQRTAGVLAALRFAFASGASLLSTLQFICGEGICAWPNLTPHHAASHELSRTRAAGAAFAALGALSYWAYGQTSL